MTTRLASDFEVRKITATIGAEVSGVDISHPLDAPTTAALRSALNEHKALVFREVDLNDEDQERFAGAFGPLTAAHPNLRSVDETSRVLPVDSEVFRANNWHTDVTFILNPPQISTLRSVILPPYGGETLIANTAAAYRAMPEVLRRFADTLSIVHGNDYDYAVVPESLTEEDREHRAVGSANGFETIHPAVRVHPLTGERALLLGAFAHRIVGLSHDESREIIRLLQSYVTRPEHVLRVRWEPNQLVLFDQRCTQHYGVDNYDDKPRLLARVTVAGDIPAGVDGSLSYGIKGDASYYSPVLERVEVPIVA